MHAEVRVSYMNMIVIDSGLFFMFSLTVHANIRTHIALFHPFSLPFPCRSRMHITLHGRINSKVFCLACSKRAA
jgi:hypothetical protein